MQKIGPISLWGVFLLGNILGCATPIQKMGQGPIRFPAGETTTNMAEGISSDIVMNPRGRRVNFLATTGGNKKSGFKFNRELKANETCQVVYGRDNYEAHTLDVNIFPPRGLHPSIFSPDPWVFDLGLKNSDMPKYRAKPLGEAHSIANTGVKGDTLIVEGLVSPGIYLRKSITIDLPNHFIHEARYEFRRGSATQSFDQMEPLQHLSCVLVMA